MAEKDQEALSILYERYRRVVFGLSVGILRDRTDAEEVVADVFFQAWRGAGGYDRLRGSVSSWLVMLCRSRSIDRLRARGRRESGRERLQVQGTEGTPAERREAGAEELMEMQLKKKRITDALGALPLEQRRALELAFYGGLSHSEVAVELGEPLGTIKSRIRQALSHLREGLEKETKA
ncbi:MAG TPA: sigma-70 family RNA polymerase sigma factor [Candidatus Polarisedimenticolia bacterium]|jgi:RNA polymerase sigma-70 factor (ECF subfamily)|nr:sigma-70 family RNA polymerase sigma factor [Candidatus Polarisedimenticolia bacterium]